MPSPRILGSYGCVLLLRHQKEQLAKKLAAAAAREARGAGHDDGRGSQHAGLETRSVEPALPSAEAHGLYGDFTSSA